MQNDLVASEGAKPVRLHGLTNHFRTGACTSPAARYLRQTRRLLDCPRVVSTPVQRLLRNRPLRTKSHE